jgi:hypothetical protein
VGLIFGFERNDFRHPSSRNQQMSVFTVSQVARRFGVAPYTLSTLFYKRALNDELCPVVSGRRIIPAEYLPEIEAELRRRGLLAQVSEMVPA